MPDEVTGLPESYPKGYQEQRQRVILILKDFSNPYSTDRSCNPFASEADYQPPPEISFDEVSDGHWNLTPEAQRLMRREKKGDPYVRSRKLVEEALDHMKFTSIHYYALVEVFLRDEAGTNDYDELLRDHDRKRQEIQKAAQKMADELEPKQSSRDVVRYLSEAYRDHPKARLLADVEMAIHTLTMLLAGEDLHVVYPSKAAPTNTRKVSMEEKYHEIFRVFASWCEDLAKTRRRYRNQAYKNTVVSTGETRSTVERAVRFSEAPFESQDAVLRRNRGTLKGPKGQNLKPVRKYPKIKGTTPRKGEK